MKTKLLKHKGIPISPIVLFKTILNNKNKTLDKVLDNLEKVLRSLINNKASELNNKINKCFNRLNTTDNNYYELKAEVTKSLKEYDIAYIDGIFYYNSNNEKRYNFKNIKKVEFGKFKPIDLSNVSSLSIKSSINMSDYEFDSGVNSDSRPSIKEKSTNKTILLFERNSIELVSPPTDNKTHSFYLYGKTPSNHPNYYIAIEF